MELASTPWYELAPLPTAGLVALLIVWRRGCLRGPIFDTTPPRRVGLGTLDLALGWLAMFAGILVAGSVAAKLGLNPPGDEASSTDSAFTAAQYMQQALLDQALTKLPVVLLVFWRCSHWLNGVRELGMGGGRAFTHNLKSAALGLAVATPMAMGLGVASSWIGELLNHPAPTIGHELLSVLQDSPQWWTTAGLLASAVLVAPLTEEIIFRGLIQTSLLNALGWGKRWTVIVLASLIFAGMHAGQPWQTLPSLFVLALVLGWLYERTGSLWPSVLVHAGFNAINAALAITLVSG